MSQDDQKKLAALARATEVFIALDILTKHRGLVTQIMDNHNPAHGDNAARRDCETFLARLRELLLLDRAVAVSKLSI